MINREILPTKRFTKENTELKKIREREELVQMLEKYQQRIKEQNEKLDKIY
jgi:hypothetical protein